MFSVVSSFCYNQICSNVTYNRKNPQTMVVFVPLVSFVVQHMQITNIKTGYVNSPRIPDKTLKQLDTNYTWNAIGSLTQVIAFIALTIFTDSFLFLPFLCVATCQFYSSTEDIKTISMRTGYNEPMINKMWKVLSTDDS